ncbi:MAG TPA: hypothetical protein VLG10_09090 [Methylomirabilota bacterium]|nr:hypothetical protein [Methylomirabilota bacterium]
MVSYLLSLLLKDIPSTATLSKWAFGDLSFTLMPIAIIFAISQLGRSDSSEPLLWREWSFGSIVLLGTALVKLVNLKTKLQRDFSEARLVSGLRFIVILLVATAIVLALVVLRESGVALNGTFLGRAQLILFSGAALLLLIWQHLSDQFFDVPHSPIERVTYSEAWGFSSFSLEEACARLGEVQKLLSTHQQFRTRLGTPNGRVDSEQLVTYLDRAQSSLDTLRAAVRTNNAAG